MKTGVMMLKIQLCITGRNYILKYIKLENSHVELQSFLTAILFLRHTNVNLVSIRDVFQKHDPNFWACGFIFIPLSQSQTPRCQFCEWGFSVSVTHQHVISDTIWTASALALLPLCSTFLHKRTDRKNRAIILPLLSYDTKTSASHHRMFWQMLQNKNTNKCIMLPERI